MALRLYNPKTKTFSTYAPDSSADMALNDLLLVNILIELKAIAHYTANFNAGTATEEVTNILTDIVSVQ